MSATLVDLQRQMAAAVMEPLTRRESTRKIRRDGAVMEREAAAFIKPNHSLTSLERLEIYNRQYWFRLYSSFEDDFPGLQAVLGRKRFEGVMHAYLEACPSTSFTLRDLGARLPEWLPGHEHLTGERSRLAQDVVRLEWAHIEAYDAGVLPTPTPEFLAAISDETRLRLQPSIRLLQLSYPVDDLLIAVRQGAGSSDTSSNNAKATRKAHLVRRIANLAPMPIWLAVHRQEFTVYYKRLTPAEFQMLTAIHCGATLSEVFATAEFDPSIEESGRANFFQDCFYQWSVLGWLSPAETATRTNLAPGDIQ